MIGALGSVMPLAKRARAVTGFLECLRDGDFIHIEAFLTGGNASHAGAGIISAGEKFGPCGRANTAEQKSGRTAHRLWLGCRYSGWKDSCSREY